MKRCNFWKCYRYYNSAKTNWYLDTWMIICTCECTSCSNFLAFRVWVSLLGGRPGVSDPEYSLTSVHLSIKCFSQATSLQRLLLCSFINSEIWRYVTGSGFVGFVFRNTEGWRDMIDFLTAMELTRSSIAVCRGNGIRRRRKTSFVRTTIQPFEIFKYLKFKPCQTCLFLSNQIVFDVVSMYYVKAFNLHHLICEM